MLFTTAERCRGTTAECASTALTATTAGRWPDVPFDKICTATTCPGNPAPTFFTRKKLSSIVTQAYSGAAYSSVDQWVLSGDFLANNDTTSPAWNLLEITHTGLAGTAITMPTTFFCTSRNPTGSTRSAIVQRPSTNSESRRSSQIGGFDYGALLFS